MVPELDKLKEYNHMNAIEYIVKTNEQNPHVDGWVVDYFTGKVRVRILHHPVTCEIIYMDLNGLVLTTLDVNLRSNEVLVKTEKAWNQLEDNVLSQVDSKISTVNPLTEQIVYRASEAMRTEQPKARRSSYTEL